MSNEEILKAAISKAVKNGYRWYGKNDYNVSEILSYYYIGKGEYNESKKWFEIIFSHDFAKAFFALPKDLEKDGICLHCNMSTKIANPSGYCDHVYFPEHSCLICGNSEDWQYHLQKMVLEEDPILYLSKFINDKT